MRAPSAVLLVTVSTLCGCAGATYYQKLETPQVARVRFSGSGNSHTGILVAQFESPTCEYGKGGGIMGVVGGIGAGTPIPLANPPPHVRETGNTQQMIGYGPTVGPAPLERAIAADRVFIFTLRRVVESWVSLGVPTIWTCTITRQFTPRAGEQYEVVYAELPFNEKTQKPSCEARVTSLQLASDGTVRRLPVPSFRAPPQVCAPEAGK